MNQTHRAGLVFAIACAALAGCTVGPNFQRPAAPAATMYTETPVAEQTASAPGPGGVAQHLNAGADLPALWWTLFRSEPLDRMVRLALTDSPTLAAAEATLREAQENLSAERSALLFPQVDGQVGASRQKTSLASAGLPGTSVFSLYYASVNVNYALDAFGGNRRQLEALEALVDYQGFQLEGAHLALTSNVVTTAIREAAVRAEIQATQEIIAAQDKQLSLVQRQYDLGAIARLTLVAQQSEAARTRSLLPPLERELAQARHRLAVLTGHLPSEGGGPEFDLDLLTLPVDVPLSVPSALAQQRPDVRAAEALLHQASAQIGVATANQYPQITLSGNFGTQSLQLHRLFSGPSIWGIGIDLLQPLFHAGELDARRRAAVAAYDAAAAQYRGTVLQSFQDVADALRALESDAQTLRNLSEAVVLARNTLDLTQKQFQLGGANYLALTDAQRNFQQVRLTQVQAQANRYADTAALFQALGGGWWNRDADTDKATKVSTK